MSPPGLPSIGHSPDIQETTMSARTLSAALALILALPACVAGTQNAVTTNSSGGAASGTILPRANGG